MLLPVTCPICGARGSAPCATCASKLTPAPELALPAGLDGCRALLSYEGAGRELVARLKYRNARAALGPLAGAMARLADRAVVDVVTWAPTTPARRRERGFDQARLLGRAVARRLGRPCRSLLRRAPGPAQTGRTLDARRAGPVFAPRGPVPARVLLVDDVVTSGATVSAAAAALRRGGATTVWVVAAARTPLKAAPASSDPAR